MAIASWLTPAAKSGTGNKTVGLTASKNTGASRTTIVTVSVSGITKTINCTQTEADKFTIKISALIVQELLSQMLVIVLLVHLLQVELKKELIIVILVSH